MKEKLSCYTINSFSLIPVTRYLINLFSRDFNVKILECHIDGQYQYADKIQVNNFGYFKNYAKFNRQSFFFRIYKYIRIVSDQCAGLFSKRNVYYTCDIQVLFILIFFKKVFFRNKTKILYHQFEQIEVEFLGKPMRFIWFYILRNSRYINLAVFPEKCRMEYFISESGFAEKNSFLFPNTCDKKSTELNELPEAFARLKNLDPKTIVVAHIGSIGTDHYLAEFVELINSLKAENYFFLIVGRYDAAVLNRFANISNSNVVLSGLIPHKQLQNLYAYIDYGFILYKGINRNFENCAPNKLYEYWANGIPVIAHRLSGLVPVVKNEFQGHLVDLNNPEVNSKFKMLIKHKPDKTKLINFFNEELAIENVLSGFELRLKQIIHE